MHVYVWVYMYVYMRMYMHMYMYMYMRTYMCLSLHPCFCCLCVDVILGVDCHVHTHVYNLH